MRYRPREREGWLAMLDHVRVLDLSDERALLAGQILADLGADVIAIEPPEGSSARRVGPFDQADDSPESSLFWRAYARNKRGITLDLDTAAGRSELLRLGATADLVIESEVPGALAAKGLGYSELSADNPRLSMVSITPFGQQGPKADWAANSLTMLAASGVLQLTGDDDRAPVQVPGEQAYLHAGAEAAVAALVALTAAERDGIGQHVDISIQTATMMATQSFILAAGWDPSSEAGRIAGGAKLGPLRVQFVQPASDGHVSVTFLFGEMIGPYTRRLFEWMYEEGAVDAATRDKDWVAYAALLVSGDEPVSELQRCSEAIAKFTRQHTKQFLFEEALRRRLLIVPVNTTADVLASRQLAAREFWMPSAPGTTDGPRYPGPFARFSDRPLRYRREAPRLGQHNEEVAREAAGRRASARAVAPGRPATTAALEGIKVVDLSWVVATPFGTRYLADCGATVIHVESTTRPDALRGYAAFWQGEPGAERSSQYANVQANKLGLSLNLATEAGRGVLERLVRWTDVLVESYAPGAMARWGMEYERLRELNPRLVMLSSSLNGQSGPEAGLAGFGTMGSALAGFGEITGWPDRPPAGPFVAYTDYSAPKFVAASILAALAHVRRGGQGQHIDLSQGEAGIHFLAPALLETQVNGHVAERIGNRSRWAAPHGVYRCVGDDRWVALACESDEQWRALCDAMGRGDWANDASLARVDGRLARQDELDAAIAQWTAEREVGDLELALQAAGVPTHRAATSSDAFADPQLNHRGHFARAEHPMLGSVPIEAARIRLSRTPPVGLRAGPTFGQDNEYVLRELLGMSEDEVTALAVAGGLE